MLPRPRRYPRGGRPRVSDRAALTGIVYVLKTGIPWEYLPREMGCGSGVTCWRRLRDWQAAGVFDHLHQRLLNRLAEAERIDFSRAALDSRTLAAKKGAPMLGRTRPTKANRARSSMFWSSGTGSL